MIKVHFSERRVINLFLQIAFWFILSLPYPAAAQQIEIGKSVPNTEFGNVLNYKTDKLKFSDFNDKLVILDFWGVNCSSCIRSFPELESLQKYFQDEIQILLVNTDSRETTERFFLKRIQIKKPSLPLITSDSILNNSFPHTGVPFHVWIDGKGIVRFTANSFNLTKTNIQKFLNSENLDIKKVEKYSAKESLIDKEWESKITYYSYIAKCINEGDMELTGPANRPLSIATYGCYSAAGLYQFAFDRKSGTNYFARPARTVLELKDSFKYIRPNTNDQMGYWYENNSFYYQLLLPDNNLSDKYDVMIADLNRYFNFVAKIEKRKINCLTLIRTSKSDKLQTKGGIPKNNFKQVSSHDTLLTIVRHFINYPWSDFSRTFQSLIENIWAFPFFDDTNYKGNVDISMKGATLDSFTLAGLKKELKRYDLDLVYREKMIEVLVLRKSDMHKKEIKKSYSYF